MNLVPILLTLALGLVKSGQVGGFLLSTKSNVACGEPTVDPSANARIVGGREAKPGSFPWTVLLAENNYPLCGGAILNDRVILTAAHCFEDAISQDPTRWRVLVGKHNLDKYDFTQRSHSVRQIVMHEKYNQRSVENDVALLFLSDRIDFTAYVRPICLPDPHTTPSPGTVCYVAGWGDTQGTGKQNVLNEVALPIVSDAQCGRPDWYGKDFYPDTSFCAGYSDGGKDACSGDSGGPLVCKYGERWYVEGISSWGYSCAQPKWPGIYAEVVQYTEWIKTKMAQRGAPYTYN